MVWIGVCWSTYAPNCRRPSNLMILPSSFTTSASTPLMTMLMLLILLLLMIIMCVVVMKMGCGEDVSEVISRSGQDQGRARIKSINVRVR